ncbi:hypothetical protein Pint_27561 [Pistacia integerrima]|uniref:Uncharacterized protein n=1 Tax=Pistacia integerrima TaxID=434235 RepID=A0ACC0YV23_9ROSI|nr:hypothetical protein Pint_27561 [Pistacia integerrima]
MQKRSGKKTSKKSKSKLEKARCRKEEVDKKPSKSQNPRQDAEKKKWKESLQKVKI